MIKAQKAHDLRLKNIHSEPLCIFDSSLNIFNQPRTFRQDFLYKAYVIFDMRRK